MTPYRRESEPTTLTHVIKSRSILIGILALIKWQGQLTHHGGSTIPEVSVRRSKKHQTNKCRCPLGLRRAGCGQADTSPAAP